MERIILVVDDEPPILRALQRALRHDWTVLATSDVKQALGWLAQRPVSVVLCDYRMPSMTGLEFLTQVRANWPTVRRYLLSGQADFAAVSAAIAQGACHLFLAKPWRDDQLREHIEAGWQHWYAGQIELTPRAPVVETPQCLQHLGQLLASHRLGLLFQYDPLAEQPELHYCLAEVLEDGREPSCYNPLSLYGVPEAYLQQLVLWAEHQLQAVLTFNLGMAHKVPLKTLVIAPAPDQPWRSWQDISIDLPVTQGDQRYAVEMESDF